MANSCGRAARGDDVGRELFAFLCRMLLTVAKNKSSRWDKQLRGFEMRGLELRSSMNLG